MVVLPSLASVSFLESSWAGAGAEHEGQLESKSGGI